MNRETKDFAIKKMEEIIGQTVENADEFFNSLGIKPMDVFTRFNDKYTHKNEDGNDRCSTWTMSNGTAWDCPALHLGLCDLPCYGLDGFFKMDDVKRNKHFQGLVMNIAPAMWLFSAIKYCATNNRLAKGNELLALRLNEVSDLTQPLLDKWCDVAEMLLDDEETRHIKLFTYTKMRHLDFSRVAKLPNFCINASESETPLYEGGNCFNAKTKAEMDKVVETDTHKKCNCDINCGLDFCGFCYEDNGLIIDEELH